MGLLLDWLHTLCHALNYISWLATVVKNQRATRVSAVFITIRNTYSVGAGRAYAPREKITVGGASSVQPLRLDTKHAMLRGAPTKGGMAVVTDA